jgi:NADPH2:quinone reductase
MRAWVVDELAGLAALKLADRPEPPAPGAGEATVAMIAVGLNYPDLLMLSGGYQYRPALPFTPGMEGVGRIVAVGEGVSADLLGARMLVGGRTGLLAERVTLPLASLRPAPETLSDSEAAGFSVGALTAFVALSTRGRLASGERLLVLGAGGGMGLAAVSVGRALGGHVIAAASSADKLAAAARAGAHETLRLDRAAPDLGALRDSIDLVFDPVGGAAVAPALGTLRWGGRYLVIGFVAGPPVAVAFNRLLLKGISIVGVRAGEAGRQDPAAGRAHVHAIDRLADAGRVPVLVGAEYPFADAPRAFEAMASGTLVGKAIIRCDQQTPRSD